MLSSPTLIPLRLRTSSDAPRTTRSAATGRPESSSAMHRGRKNFRAHRAGKPAGAWDLLGLYDGIPLTERSVDDSGNLPDVIYIFRNAHLEMNLPRDELIEEIVTTLVHEIAHYFGIDDDHLDEIGWG